MPAYNPVTGIPIIDLPTAPSATDANQHLVIATPTGSGKVTKEAFLASLREDFDALETALETKAPLEWMSLNVKNFGATGNGATDDTAAFEAAASAVNATSTGWSIYIPRGTYRITRTISFTKNVSIVWQDKYSTRVHFEASASHEALFGTTAQRLSLIDWNVSSNTYANAWIARLAPSSGSSGRCDIINGEINSGVLSTSFKGGGFDITRGIHLNVVGGNFIRTHDNAGIFYLLRNGAGDVPSTTVNTHRAYFSGWSSVMDNRTFGVASSNIVFRDSIFEYCGARASWNSGKSIADRRFAFKFTQMFQCLFDNCYYEANYAVRDFINSTVQHRSEWYKIPVSGEEVFSEWQADIIDVSGLSFARRQQVNIDFGQIRFASGEGADPVYNTLRTTNSGATGSQEAMTDAITADRGLFLTSRGTAGRNFHTAGLGMGTTDYNSGTTSIEWLQGFCAGIGDDNTRHGHIVGTRRTNTSAGQSGATFLIAPMRRNATPLDSLAFTLDTNGNATVNGGLTVTGLASMAGGILLGGTTSQVVLGNGSLGASTGLPVSTAAQTALDAKADLVSGLVPASQLPAYVDDVLEFANVAGFPATGETGKVYVALDTNQTYRWSGSAYVIIGNSLALGETSSTAYRGDRGKTAYDHTLVTGNPHSTTKGDVGLGNVDNTSDANKPVSTATQTALDAKVNRTSQANRKRVGEYHSPQVISEAAPANTTPVQNTLRVYPFTPTSSYTIDAFQFEVATTGNSTVTFGIYDSAIASGIDAPMPNTLLATSTATAMTAGMYTVPISPTVTLSEGMMYWVALQTGASITGALRGFQANAVRPLLGHIPANGLTANRIGFSVARTATDLPTSMGATLSGASNLVDTNTPAVYVKTASNIG